MSDKETTKIEKSSKIVNDLVLDMQTKREQLASLRLDHTLGKLKNPNEIRKVRKEIAQIKTKLSLNTFIAETDNN